MQNINKTYTSEEEIFFANLRASNWDEFYGQEQVKKSLLIAINAAKQRNEPVDHTLLYGPPGLGKTTLSHLIAKEMGSEIKITAGTALTKTGDLAAILTNLNDKDVLFIDEIHRLPKVVEESLYSAMEDFSLDIVIGKGPSARTVRIDLPHFTLVGATTRFGLLAGPFRDRFGIIHRLDFYTPKFLSIIIQNGARKLGISIDEQASIMLAERSRGTPRIALKLLKRVRDFTQLKNKKVITASLIDETFKLLEIDSKGLNESERRFLRLIIEKHNGGPVGLSTICATITEDPGTVEEILEPYLMKLGFIKRTPKGRIITKKAYEHLNIPYPEDKEEINDKNKGQKQPTFNF